MKKGNIMDDIKDLKITDVEIWNDENKNIGVRLSWSCNVGFGQYTIGYHDGKWYVDSECMESPEDREFGRLVLATWLDNLKDNPVYKFGEE